MKRLLAALVVLVMVVSSVSAFAYTTDPTQMGYNYGYGNNYGYNYGYNCTGMRQSWSEYEIAPSQWFEVYAQQYGVVFHLAPTMPISRNDVFAPVGKALNMAYSEAGRNFSNSYGVNFVDYTWQANLNQIAGGLYQRGIMIGYPEDNTVRFINNITRGEFAKVVCLVAQQNGINPTYTNMNFQFADMVNHWASQYASQCHAMSLMVGKTSNCFDPEGLVTYEEFVTVMLRLSELSGRSNYSIDFEDVAFGISDTMDIDFDGYEYTGDFELSVSGSKIVYMSVGETEELKVKATPSDIKLGKNDVEWEASRNGYVKLSNETVENQRYATVEVKALKEGEITVTAVHSDDEDVYVDFTIVISEDEYDGDEVLVTSISVNPTAVELGVGESETITATVKPSNATDKGIIWKSHNTAVATVTQSGKITAVGVGNTTVTAEANDGSGVIATIDVTVTANQTASDSIAPVVEITGADNVAVGQKITLTVVVDEENLDSFEITEADLLGLTGGASINKINKVSNDTYEITLMGVEVSSLALCINSGVAVDAAGNRSAESNEVIIFINSGENL